MASLKKIWLSGNKFTGKIPDSLAKVPNLMELHLENNQFSGPIPAFPQKTLNSFDLSNNNLEGEIPESLSKFPGSSFGGNDGLCGKLINKECNSPPAAPVAASAPEEEETSNKVLIMVVIVFVMIVLLVLTSVMSARRKEDFNVLGKENLGDVVEVHVPNSSHRRVMESSRKGIGGSRRGSQQCRSLMGDLVMVNEEKGTFGLPDLMKAAAEVLGNGGLGSAYKAVLGNGMSVVVKRMREMNRLGRDGFDAEIKMIGRIRHRNLLTPLAYHYRKEEKLIVSQYIPKGSLLYALHGEKFIIVAISLLLSFWLALPRPTSPLVLLPLL
ncbi:hypothetical protein L1049_022320 [Liquidambar formosana]|uniref:Protein kinase domain-containing protein n=1 Tax=Liquidambar formosana TaxID=63359 RepID=A0AAP0WNQ1_LIQFO